MHITISSMEIIASKQNGCNPLPIFQDRKRDLAVATEGPLEEADYINMGQNAAFCVLPYRMQDRYTRATERANIKTLVLENETLRATFLPDYGARLWSLYHKVERRELLFCNPVLQLGNLAIRNAWFSGGIEWNIAQYGHTFGTCSPMFAAAGRAARGNEFLRFYQFERCREIFWQLDFHLPPGAKTLRLYARIINDTARSLPMYWWTNIAVPETKGVRVFSEEARVLYIVPQKDKCFATGKLPEISSLPGKDASYPGNFLHSSEYFFQNDSLPAAPWEAVSYENGTVFFERSSSRLRYRKMFCWGCHAGGQRWKDFLSLPGQGNYLEIQAGMAPTQLHGLQMPARREWDFVQVFGGATENQVFDGDWPESCQKIRAVVERHIPEKNISEWLAVYRALGRLEPEKLLHTADGWGALELRRRKISDGKILGSMIFSAESLGPEQSDWLCLLERGYLPQPAGLEAPSWQTNTCWQKLLEASLPAQSNWYSHLHLGVMYYEQGLCEAGLAQWRKSLQLRENPIAQRNLAYHQWKNGNLAAAACDYQKIFAAGLDGMAIYIAEEYLEILLHLEHYETVWSFYRQNTALRSAKLEVLAARAAVELGETEFVAQLLQKGYPQLKEGENWLSDIWYIAKAKELGDDSAELRQRVRREYTVPPDIDFCMKKY